MTNAYDRTKRLLDIAISLPVLLLSLPLQIVVAALVRWKLGSPVLFRQVRPGLHGEPFELIKFRTMRPLRDGESLHDDGKRLTPFGRRLRSTSIDELPTLWNVARGDMSLVGPRPLLMEYLGRYSPRQTRRHEVRPGVTGLAQVSGRNALTWDEKLEIDVQYVERRSLSLDLWVLVRTVSTVFARKGVAADGQATMTEFQGSAHA